MTFEHKYDSELGKAASDYAKSNVEDMPLYEAFCAGSNFCAERFTLELERLKRENALMQTFVVDCRFSMDVRTKTMAKNILIQIKTDTGERNE